MTGLRNCRIAVLALAQYSFAVLLLRHVYPVYFDGGGPTPSFFVLSNGHLPTLGEYYARQQYYDFQYLFPYYIAALVVVILTMWAAPRLVKPPRSRFHIVLVSFSLLVAAAAISDLLATAGLLNVAFFAHFEDVLTFVILALPLAATSALFGRN